MITFKTNQLVNNQKQKRSVQFCLALWEHLVNLFEVLNLKIFEMEFTLDLLPGLDLILPIIVDSLDIKSVCQLR